MFRQFSQKQALKEECDVIYYFHCSRIYELISVRVRLVRKCQKIDMINVRCVKKCHCHMTKYQNAESQIYPLSNCQFRPMFYLKQEI